MAINYTYKPFEEDEELRRRRAALEAAEAGKPAAYSGSYASAVDEALKKIQNREKFSYDMNADALYQQYKDSYTRQGKLAMEDTIGKAAALTGGYGNSYAQQAGQQAYAAYLDKLNDRIPELYAAAYDRYRKEGEDLKDEYAMLSAREQQEYVRHRDSVDDYYKDLSYQRQAYGDAYDRGYGRYSDEQNRLYQLALAAQDQANTDRAFAENKRQYEESKAAAAAKLAEDARQADMDYELAMAKLNANNKGTAGAGDVYETEEQKNARITSGGSNSGKGIFDDPTELTEFETKLNSGEYLEVLRMLGDAGYTSDEIRTIAKDKNIDDYFVNLYLNESEKTAKTAANNDAEIRKMIEFIAHDPGEKYKGKVSRSEELENAVSRLEVFLNQKGVSENAQYQYLEMLFERFPEKDVTAYLAKMKGKTTGKAKSGAKDNYLQGSFDDRLRY